MLYFDRTPVPGAELVEIVEIREKDGSPLAPDNWRKKLFGQITFCWIAGGFQRRGAFFKGNIRMKEDNSIEVDMYDNRWCSTTTAQPIEVEPGVFDFETNTCIYRFRILSEVEEKSVIDAITETRKREIEALYHMVQPADADMPPS